MPAGEGHNWPFQTHIFNDALGWNRASVSSVDSLWNGNQFAPQGWMKLQVNPYDWQAHEGDSAALGVERCPVCGKERTFSFSRIWDDSEQRRIEARDVYGCDCPPVHERK